MATPHQDTYAIAERIATRVIAQAIAQARAEGERAGRVAGKIEMRERAAKVASEYNCWDYVAKKPDGSWGPGSPYDQGQLNAAQMITAGIMLLTVEGE